MMTAQTAPQSALFIEESRQLLLQIEQGWQQAKPGDSQWRGQMLRQLHQLKGMAASFDEAAAADCCHQLETQLNQHTAALTPGQAVSVSQILGRLHEILHHVHHGTKTAAEQQAAMVNIDAEQRWQIDFKPLPGFFANGQDPLYYLKQLQQLGDMTVQADRSQLPVFADFDASQPYLSWQIILKSNVGQQTIQQVFDWVADVCELQIRAVAENPPVTDNPAAIPSPATQQDTLRQILNRHQQQTAWLEELQQAADGLPVALQNRLDQLQLAASQNYLALQKLLLKPISNAYQRLPSLLHTVCKQTGKQATLILPQQPLWLPSRTVDFISDVLIQLLRNAIAHGVESPDLRVAAGKPREGTIRIEQALHDMQLTLNFYDDGGGLQSEKILAAAGELSDTDINELIFQPGLSTASAPDLLSGRGIGLDLVRQHIARLDGQISVRSTKGQDCCFHISVPLRQTLQVLQAVAVADQYYLLSPDSIMDDLPASSLPVRHVNGRGEFIEYQQQWLPVLDLKQRFKLSGPAARNARLLIISEQGRQRVLRVDNVLPAAEYLLSAVDSHYQPLPGILALATDGRCQPALWLDWQYFFGERS